MGDVLDFKPKLRPAPEICCELHCGREAVATVLYVGEEGIEIQKHFCELHVPEWATVE